MLDRTGNAALHKLNRKYSRGIDSKERIGEQQE